MPLDPNRAVQILALIKELEDLGLEGFALIRTLTNRLRGASDAEVAAIGHAINASVVKEADAEIARAKQGKQ
jgi:hypothetical protein